MLGCLSIGAFAADTDTAIAAETPTANGILSPEELQKLSDAGTISRYKGYGFPEVDPNVYLWALGRGTDACGIFTIGKLNGDGDSYLKVSKNTIAATSYANSYFDITNTVGTALDTIAGVTANATADDLGAPFVLSIDLKAEAENVAENYANATTIDLFHLRSYVCESGNVAVSLLGIGANENGKLGVWYRSASGDSATTVFISNYDLPNDKFATVAVLVTPKTNSYNIYVDGKLTVENVGFLKSSEAALLKNPSAGIPAQTDAFGNDASYKNYIMGLCRMSTVAIGSGTGANTVGTDYGIDNVKFYNADYYVECAAHDFGETQHTHNADGTVAYGSVCKNCTLDLRGNREFTDADNNSVCDECEAAKPTAGGVLTPSQLSSNSEIRALNGEEFNDEFPTTVWRDNGLFANNGGFHAVTEENGNKYVKIGGNTTGADNYVAIFNAPIPVGGLNNRAYIQSLIKNGTYGDFAGRSFVVSVDIKVENQSYVMDTTPIFMLKTYASNNSSVSFENYLLRLRVKEDENGNKKTYIAYNYANDPKAENVIISDHAIGDEFETVSVFVNPSKNTYNIYIDGELLVGDIPFLSETDLKNVMLYDDSTAKAVKDASGNDIKGGDAYILSFARFFQINGFIHGSGNYSIGMDNVKLYYAEKYVECAEHDFDLKSTEALKDGRIELNYACSCGEVYSAIAKGAVIDKDVAVLGRSGSLGEKIGFKLYTEIGNNTVSANDAKMVITMGGETIAEYPIAELEKVSERYVFDFKFASTDMAKTITAKIVTADGESEVYETSFEDYAEALLESADAKLAALLESTLNYGAYAQDYFTAKDGTAFDAAPDKLLASEISDFDAALLEGYDVTVSGENDAISVDGATLVLESTTTVRIFFTGGTSATIGQDGEALEIKKSGNYNYVEIKDIMPQDLAKSTTVVIADGDNSVSVEVSVLACAKIVITRDGFSSEFKDLAKAIVLYCKAAEAYMA